MVLIVVEDIGDFRNFGGEHIGLWVRTARVEVLGALRSVRSFRSVKVPYGVF